MPGLAILLTSAEKHVAQRDLRRMVDAMHHEPFYISDTYCDENLGFYLGWVGHANSFSGRMPLSNAAGDLLVFFHGEHHSDRNGSRNGNASCEVLRLWEAHGLEALPLLNGWFHGVVVDLRRKEVVIFNDRYGMQRLYCYVDGETTLFASEAKSLLNVRPQLRTLDPRGVAEFLTCGCVLENRSLFAGISALPPATVQVHAPHGKKKEYQYFNRETWEAQSPLTEPEFHSVLEHTLPRSVQRCLDSNPLPTALSLTGGFDTRLIMACLNQAKTPLPCYTFGGMYQDCFDVKIGRKIAAMSGCAHQVLELDPAFLQSFPALAEQTISISDGGLGATNAYELYLNRLARQVAPVRLTGSFGSEVMRGARAFKALPPTDGLIQQNFQPHIDDAIETFDHIGRGHGLSFSVFKHAPWYYYNRLVVEQSQLIVRTPFMDNDFVSLFYRRPDTIKDGRELARRVMESIAPSLAKLPTDTGNCSYWRQQWIQFLFKADYCYKSGMPQWLEKIHHLLGPFQPEKLIRGTHRFAHFRIWFRNQLAPYVKEMLLDPRTLRRPFFNRVHIEQMVARHLKGDRNYTEDIERVLTVELTCRLFTDN